MTLLRIPFILSAAWALHILATAPNPSPQETERIKPSGTERFFANTIPWLPTVSKVLFWTWTLFEVAVIIGGADPRIYDILSAALVPSGHSALDASKIRITPPFLVGWFFALSGGLIRLASYRALGDLFTFELTIRKEHKLITSGPYSIVRHPSYTAIVMAVFGYCTCQLSPGSWLRECSGLSLHGTAGKVLLTIWAATCMVILSALVARTYREDALLRKEFGDWDQWAKEVPWRLIPFIY